MTAEEGTGRLIRTIPRSISGPDGAARELAELTGLPEDRCARAIQEGLLASYACEPDPDTGRPPFAFRLHQFISRGDTVYASLEAEAERHLTVRRPAVRPRRPERVLLPPGVLPRVRPGILLRPPGRTTSPSDRDVHPRDLSDIHDDGGERGRLPLLQHDRALAVRSRGPRVLERLPERLASRSTAATTRVREGRPQAPAAARHGRHRRQGDGRTRTASTATSSRRRSGSASAAAWPTYSANRRSDFAKLATLGSEGRSTATTILSLSAVRGLSADEDLGAEGAQAAQLHRQPPGRLAAGRPLQRLRRDRPAALGALPGGARGRARRASTHDELAQQRLRRAGSADRALRQRPGGQVPGARPRPTRALRDVLGYRLYRDLKRGWRVTSPNLEQCGLLRDPLPSLSTSCAQAEDVWQDDAPGARRRRRPRRARRSPRCCSTSCAASWRSRSTTSNADCQEQLKQQLAASDLIRPWAIDENEAARVRRDAVPAPPARAATTASNVYLSRARRLRPVPPRRGNLPRLHEHAQARRDRARSSAICSTALRVAGLVEAVAEADGDEDVPGYQLPASAMRWRRRRRHRALPRPDPRPDALRRTAAAPTRSSSSFYRDDRRRRRRASRRASTPPRCPTEEREEREDELPRRRAAGPVLLADDGARRRHRRAERREPAQRPADAGQLRPAQRARRPQRPAGAGLHLLLDWQPPRPVLLPAARADGRRAGGAAAARPGQRGPGPRPRPRGLAGRDRRRASAARSPTCSTSTATTRRWSSSDVGARRASTTERAERARARARRARPRARSATSSQRRRLVRPTSWLDDVLDGVGARFDHACDRWRDLYRAALAQRETQNDDHHATPREPPPDKNAGQAAAARGRGAARAADRRAPSSVAPVRLLQLPLLRQRGLPARLQLPAAAAVGLHPGAARPRRPRRVPLAAALPRHHRVRAARASSTTRASRYLINRVILPVERDEQRAARPSRAKQCDELRLPPPDRRTATGPDLCERCGAAARAAAHASCSACRTSPPGGATGSPPTRRSASGRATRSAPASGSPSTDGRPSPTAPRTSTSDGRRSRRSTYGHAATLWRDQPRLDAAARTSDQLGFVLDTERGYWAQERRRTTPTTPTTR